MEFPIPTQLEDVALRGNIWKKASRRFYRPEGLTFVFQGYCENGKLTKEAEDLMQKVDAKIKKLASKHK